MRGASGSRREGTPSPRASAASGLTLVINLLYAPFSFKFLNQMHQVVLACLPGGGGPSRGPSPGETHTRAPRVPEPGLNCTSHTPESPQTPAWPSAEMGLYGGDQVGWSPEGGGPGVRRRGPSEEQGPGPTLQPRPRPPAPGP